MQTIPSQQTISEITMTPTMETEIDASTDALSSKSESSSDGDEPVVIESIKSSLASQTDKSVTVHKNQTKRRQWKKPADKPKRPPSAYNIYFQFERERLLMNGNNIENDDPTTVLYSDEEVERIANEQILKKPRRKHRKTHGMIGFADLAKIIANNWKNTSSSNRLVFDRQAAFQKERYIQGVKKWESNRSNPKQQQHPKRQQQKFAIINASNVSSQKQQQYQPIEVPAVASIVSSDGLCNSELTDGSSSMMTMSTQNQPECNHLYDNLHTDNRSISDMNGNYNYHAGVCFDNNNNCNTNNSLSSVAIGNDYNHNNASSMNNLSLEQNISLTSSFAHHSNIKLALQQEQRRRQQRRWSSINGAHEISNFQQQDSRNPPSSLFLQFNTVQCPSSVARQDRKANASGSHLASITPICENSCTNSNNIITPSHGSMILEHQQYQTNDKTFWQKTRRCSTSSMPYYPIPSTTFQSDRYYNNNISGSIRQQEHRQLQQHRLRPCSTKTDEKYTPPVLAFEDDEEDEDNGIDYDHQGNNVDDVNGNSNAIINDFSNQGNIFPQGVNTNFSY